jgi:hypothetical protein
MTVTGEVTETGAVSAEIAGASPPPWDGPYAARPHLANLGFLANSDLPDRAGPAYLLVGLRAQPTLRHFDPEVVQYWVTINGRGIRQTVTRSSPLPIDREFSWGLIRTTDRLAVTNEFLTFGGRVRAEMVDDVLVVVFTSPAPILRRGGHSQRWDPGAEHIGAYFARLLLAVDLIPDFERRAAETGVVARYAAFLADAAARFRACPALRDTEPDAWHVLQTEARRVRDTHPADWHAGRELAALAKA